MNSIESAINLSLMSNEEGVQFIYDLANSNLSQEEKINTLKESITNYLFTTLEYIEDEVYESVAESVTFLSYEFLITMFGNISRIMHAT